MLELEIQKYLRAGNPPEFLTQQFAIRVTPHLRYPNLLLFKYNQIDSPMGVRVCQESRGIILDQADNYNVVCWTFSKFFNQSEGHADSIDWSTARAYTKVDGSLMQLFHYKDEWHVASSGMPDARGEINSLVPGLTFADMFWQIWKDIGYQLPLSKDFCYAFELVSGYNRIICRYPQPDLYLTGVRKLSTLEEQDAEGFAIQNRWKSVKSYPMSSLEEIVELAKTLNPVAQDGEGFVVRDSLRKPCGSFHRLKVKNPGYLALHHLKEGMSEHKMCEIIKTNECQEFLVYFPEFTELYNKLKLRFDKIAQEIETAYTRIRAIEQQKDFALLAIKYPFSGALFGLRKGNLKSGLDYLRAMPSDKLFDLLSKEVQNP